MTASDWLPTVSEVPLNVWLSATIKHLLSERRFAITQSSPKPMLLQWMRLMLFLLLLQLRAEDAPIMRSSFNGCCCLW